MRTCEWPVRGDPCGAPAFNVIAHPAVSDADGAPVCNYHARNALFVRWPVRRIGFKEEMERGRSGKTLQGEAGGA